MHERAGCGGEGWLPLLPPPIGEHRPVPCSPLMAVHRLLIDERSAMMPEDLAGVTFQGENRVLKRIVWAFKSELPITSLADGFARAACFWGGRGGINARTIAPEAAPFVDVGPLGEMAYSSAARAGLTGLTGGFVD